MNFINIVFICLVIYFIVKDIILSKMIIELVDRCIPRTEKERKDSTFKKFLKKLSKDRVQNKKPLETEDSITQDKKNQEREAHSY